LIISLSPWLHGPPAARSFVLNIIRDFSSVCHFLLTVVPGRKKAEVGKRFGNTFKYKIKNRVFFTPTRLLVISSDHTSIVFNGRMNTFLLFYDIPKFLFLFGFTGRSGTFHRFLP
jgi:hypothetical protein